MRLIDAENIENFAHEETFGTGDMVENWIAEIDIPVDVKIEYEESLKELCWKVLEGCMNVIKTEPTAYDVDKDAEEETEERHSNDWIDAHSFERPKQNEEVLCDLGKAFDFVVMVYSQGIFFDNSIGVQYEIETDIKRWRHIGKHYDE